MDPGIMLALFFMTLAAFVSVFEKPMKALIPFAAQKTNEQLDESNAVGNFVPLPAAYISPGLNPYIMSPDDVEVAMAIDALHPSEDERRRDNRQLMLMDLSQQYILGNEIRTEFSNRLVYGECPICSDTVRKIDSFDETYYVYGYYCDNCHQTINIRDIK